MESPKRIRIDQVMPVRLVQALMYKIAYRHVSAAITQFFCASNEWEIAALHDVPNH